MKYIASPQGNHVKGSMPTPLHYSEFPFPKFEVWFTIGPFSTPVFSMAHPIPYGEFAPFPATFCAFYSPFLYPTTFSVIVFLSLVLTVSRQIHCPTMNVFPLLTVLRTGKEIFLPPQRFKPPQLLAFSKVG